MVKVNPRVWFLFAARRAEGVSGPEPVRTVRLNTEQEVLLQGESAQCLMVYSSRGFLSVTSEKVKGQGC